MKKLIRGFIINFSSFWLVMYSFPAFNYEAPTDLFLPALAFSFLSLFIKPLLNIITLPLNFITMGMFSWLSAVITLYLVFVLIPEVKFSGFEFSGLNISGFVLPTFYIGKLLALGIGSFLISLTCAIIRWVFFK